MRVKIRIQNVLLLALLLVVASASFAQTAPAINAVANRSWPSFWREFSAAINKKDVAALRKMMPDDFFDGGGGQTPTQWLAFIDKNERNGSWRDLQRSVARGTVTNRSWSSKGIPTKVTKDKAYYFEFRKDRRWYFAGVVGD
jgi:hypothetical protein